MKRSKVFNRLDGNKGQSPFIDKALRYLGIKGRGEIAVYVEMPGSIELLERGKGGERTLKEPCLKVKKQGRDKEGKQPLVVKVEEEPLGRPALIFDLSPLGQINLIFSIESH